MHYLIIKITKTKGERMKTKIIQHGKLTIILGNVDDEKYVKIKLTYCDGEIRENTFYEDGYSSESW